MLRSIGCSEAKMDKGWSEALSLMQRALTILDETHAPAEIGAHLDLAIIHLKVHVDAALAQSAGGTSTPLTD
jgi:hypothetical protein